MNIRSFCKAFSDVVNKGLKIFEVFFEKDFKFNHIVKMAFLWQRLYMTNLILIVS